MSYGVSFQAHLVFSHARPVSIVTVVPALAVTLNPLPIPGTIPSVRIPSKNLEKSSALYLRSPFTELKKPLSECKVAFITAGGIHRKDQTPFNTSGDFSYRVIPFDTPSDMLMVTHGDFDNSDINKDVNAMFPIDRLHELVEEGFIGYF